MTSRALAVGLLALLALPAAAARVLIVGDSHTVGPFGGALEAGDLLAAKPDLVVFALGSNAEGSAVNTAAAAESLVALVPAGTRCVWVGPPPMPKRLAAIDAKHLAEARADPRADQFHRTADSAAVDVQAQAAAQRAQDTAALDQNADLSGQSGLKSPVDNFEAEVFVGGKRHIAEHKTPPAPAASTATRPVTPEPVKPAYDPTSGTMPPKAERVVPKGKL